MCFGAVVSDGYGVCYNPMSDHINFALSSFNNCEETKAAHLAQAIEDALLDMRTIIEQTPRAKLWRVPRSMVVGRYPEDSYLTLPFQQLLGDVDILSSYLEQEYRAAIGNLCFPNITNDQAL